MQLCVTSTAVPDDTIALSLLRTVERGSKTKAQRVRGYCNQPQVTLAELQIQSTGATGLHLPPWEVQGSL